MRTASTRHPSLRTLLLSLALMASPMAVFAATIAKPDPAMVARYGSDAKALDAKLAECGSRKDMAAALSDVACMSADEASRVAERKNLASKCNAADTFVYIPGTLKGKEYEDYVIKRAPSDAQLKNCNQTRAQWVRDKLAKTPK